MIYQNKKIDFHKNDDIQGIYDKFKKYNFD